jgi:hypothetical protein
MVVGLLEGDRMVCGELGLVQLRGRSGWSGAVLDERIHSFQRKLLRRS